MEDQASTKPDCLDVLVDRMEALVAEVAALREEVARNQEASPWMTTEQAAEYLAVSRDTLDRLAREHGHLEGGPVDVGQRRRALRWSRETVDGWFRRATGVVVEASPSVEPSGFVKPTGERFDWSTV